MTGMKKVAGARRTGLALAALLFAMLLSSLSAGPAFALPIDNGEPLPEPPGGGGTTTPFEPRPGGFVWRAQNRYNTPSDPINISGWYWDETQQIYNPGYINPTSYRAFFDGCQTGADYDASKNNQPTALNYIWEVNGTPITWGQKCIVPLDFPAQAAYQVRLTVRYLNGTHYAGAFAQNVTIRDFLIVAIGDSYGSGEGEPDLSKSSTQPNPVWLSQRCHRSHYAAAAQAAQMMEQSDSHTSVTFISFACSGANIFNDSRDADSLSQKLHPYDPRPASKSLGNGILGSYRGMEVANKDNYDPATYLPSQIQQARNAIGNRPIDALVMSAGGNDMGFSKIATQCVLYEKCYQTTVPSRDNPYLDVSLSDRTIQDQAAMPAIYSNLALRIRNDLNPRNVLITEYADPTTTDSGALCTRILEDVTFDIPILWYPEVTNVEVGWLHNNVGPDMNRQVRNAATAHGWQYVDGVADAFQGHGYCATNRFYNTAKDSDRKQGGGTSDTTGTLHPNYQGYRAIAQRTIAYLKPALERLQTPEVNLARNGYVRTSSSEDGSGWYNWALVDGNRNSGGSSSGWSSRNQLDVNHIEWAFIDLGATKTARQIVLYPRNDPARPGEGFPENFNIWVAPDFGCTNWRWVAGKMGQPHPGTLPQYYNFASQDVRCVRIEATKLRPNPMENNNYRFQLAEFEITN